MPGPSPGTPSTTGATTSTATPAALLDRSTHRAPEGWHPWSEHPARLKDETRRRGSSGTTTRRPSMMPPAFLHCPRFKGDEAEGRRGSTISPHGRNNPRRGG